MTFPTPALLAWYAQNARPMPWRPPPPNKQPNPYAVWVCETMLQQTRLETVLPYYERWMARFPDVRALAAASLQDVLNLWEGLGYYSRARSLHKAAQILVDEHRGELPPDADALRKLPGIGPYTAGAIASIAFGLDQPAVDGNARRVLARVFNVTEPVDSPAGKRRLWELAARTLPPGRAGTYNQALMDLGALVCTPRKPACTRCPLAEACQARSLGIQEQRPQRRPRARIPHWTVTAAVIQRGAQVLIARRPVNGLLGGLWEFPGGKLEPGEALQACLEREIREELGAAIRVGAPLGVYKHAYTHFRVTLHAYCCTLLEGEPRPVEAADLRWVLPAALPDFPMGKIDRQIARQVLEGETCG